MPTLTRRKTLTAADRREIYKKTNGHCHICGKQLRGKWDADHVVRHTYGGSDELSNFLPACRSCNGLRWHRHPIEFKRILRLGIYLNKQIEQDTALGRQAQALYKKKIRENKARHKAKK